MPSFNISIWGVVLLFAAIHGYALAVFIGLSKKGERKTKKHLSFLLSIIAIQLSFFMIDIEGVSVKFPHLLNLSTPLWFLIGPALYFYFVSLINLKPKFELKNLIHLIPFVFSFLIMLPFYMYSAEEKLASLSSNSSYITLILISVYMIQSILYIFLSLRLMNKYVERYKETSSFPGIIYVEWIKSVLLIFIIYLVIDFFIGMMIALSGQRIFIYTFISYLALSGFIYLIGYAFIKKPEKVFGEIELNGKGFRKTNISELNVTEKLEELNQTMKTDKLFLNSELKLFDLAEKLNLSTHQLSELLNTQMNLNFYDFVNKYRVEEAKKRLIDPSFKNLTISSIALETGFNSNASFYRIFKKHTGITPSTYIKEAKFKKSA